WADTKNFGYTTYEDLALREEVIDLIEGEVNRLTEKLPDRARVSRYVVLSKPSSADDGELTRTLKARRKFITDQYEVLIEQSYTGVDEVKAMISNGEEPKEVTLKVLEVNAK